MAKRPERKARPDAPGKAAASAAPADDVLLLDCPACDRPLEVDAGFSGGVCRCWNCGAMMTVPLNPQSEKVEKVVRAERPDEPAASPAQPASPAAEEEFVTESGKHIHVRSTRIASSRKARMGVKLAVVGVFLIFIGLTIAGTVVAVLVMSAGDDAVPVDVEAIDRDLRGYDPTINPFTMAQANVLGVTLKSPVAVVVDASYGTRQWFDLAKEAVSVGLARGSVKGQVVVAHAGGASVYPQEPGAFEDGALKGFVESYQAGGSADMVQAVERALAGKPAHLVIVAGSDAGERVGEQIAALVKAAGKVRFDAVYVGSPPASSVEQAARTSDGTAISISRVQLENWYFDQ